MTNESNIYRYKIIIEYIGSHFSGWQYQANATSIQDIIEKSIKSFSGQKVILNAAGRTDAGVHAIGQVAHFDLKRCFDPYKVMQAINHFLRPNLIGVINCELVSQTFHSRFSAKGRHYVYRIVNRAGKTIIDHERAWWIRHELVVKNMQEGAKHLIGKHDFTSFRAKQCQASSPVKTLSKIEITRTGEEIKIYVSAPSFLHHMVRNIVGSLVLVGMGKWQPIVIKDVLEAKNRELAAATAPACGLYFLKVDY